MRPTPHPVGVTMVEFLRNATIVMMGLVVMGAGVVVVFYG